MFEEAIQDIHRIAEGPWDDNGVEACELIRGEIVIGHTTIRVEVFTVRSGIHRADGDNEAQSVCRRDFPSAPGLRQGEGRLEIDEAGIGARQRLGTEIVLLRPTETAPREGRHIGAYHRFEADVAGFCQEHCTQAEGQVSDPRRPFADMGEGIGKARACMDFQEELREINPWEPRKDVVAEHEQAGGLLQFIEPCHGEGVTALALFDPHRCIGRKVGDRALIRRIKLRREAVEGWLRRFAVAQLEIVSR